MSGATVATVADASITIGATSLLTGVSFEVAPGELVAVLGTNGAGKSTLMRALLGLHPLASGTIELLGRPPRQARAQVGYLPQRHGFHAGTRVRGIDLVALGLDGARWGVPLGLTPRARERRAGARARVREAIELVGAASYARRAIGELSGGEQQRLLIATALVHRPRLLILDEPLDSLDLPNQASVAALLRGVCDREGVAVLLVAHDVNPIAAHLDRVIYLAGGRAVAGPVDEVITAPRLSELYRAPIEVLRTASGRLVVVGEPEAPHHHGHRHDHR
ncbi:MAG: metal ABC transporter ATP-binding protein [Solirubrobacteraceae bacterium]